MNSFSINKETPIVLYGLGNIGKEKCKVLLNEGYHVINIIDQNAKPNMMFCDIPVCTLDDFGRKFLNEEEIIIIVCLNNGMQHEAVVKQMVSYGYNKIIYIPMDEKMEFDFLSKMQQAYSDFLDNKFDLLKEIPIYSRTDNHLDEEIKVIFCDSDNIVFLCEVQYLYSADKKTIQQGAATESILKNILNDEKYVDKPLAMCENYKNLYDYIMGNVFYPTLYMKYFGKDEEYNQKLLTDRINLFQCYEKRYNTDVKLFNIQPSSGLWNKKGYFNISDGIHRSMYLYYVKRQFAVPVKTSKKEFECFRKYYKKSENVYKCTELMLQEKLPLYLDICKSNVAIIETSENMSAINCLKKLSESFSLFKDIKQYDVSYKEYDFVYLDIDTLEMFNEKIFSSTSKILVESSYIIEGLDWINAEVNSIGMVFKRNCEIAYFYLLER